MKIAVDGLVGEALEPEAAHGLKFDRPAGVRVRFSKYLDAEWAAYRDTEGTFFFFSEKMQGRAIVRCDVDKSKNVDVYKTVQEQNFEFLDSGVPGVPQPEGSMV